MKQRYLEVTYRNGKPLAAYFYLPRTTGAKAATTRDAGHGVRVDFDATNAPIGVEITAPSAVSLAQLREIFFQFGIPEPVADELAPIAA